MRRTTLKFFASLFLITATTFALAQKVDSDLTEDLLQISKSMNRNLPLKIDKEKVLETTAVIGDTLVFKYRFTDESVIADPRFSKERYVSALRTSLGQSTCAGSIEILNRGAKYNYLFKDRRGLTVIDFTLDAKTCKQLSRSK